jgi:uncharacterized membrane protein
MVAFFPTNYKAASLGDPERMLHEVLESVPKDASILTQDNIFPHVSHRVDAYVIPDRWIHSGDIREIAVEFVNQTMDHVEYVLVDSKTDHLAYSARLKADSVVAWALSLYAA